jgi:uncharacterized protein YjlB
MFDFETLKKAAEKLSGLARPDAGQLTRAIRRVKPLAFRFKPNNFVPNNPNLPALVYRGAIRFPQSLDPAAIFEDLFAANGYGDSWRGEIYDYAHYHPAIHEVLGIARGHTSVQLGGSEGRKLRLKKGDVAILPAGTGHQALCFSKDFLAVGAYPPTGKYSEFHALKKDYERALSQIKRVRVPKTDPVYGKDGPLLDLWKK